VLGLKLGVRGEVHLGEQGRALARDHTGCAGTGREALQPGLVLLALTRGGGLRRAAADS